jgi:tripartite-type tricarboxylate transporter receptor subunit TctC
MTLTRWIGSAASRSTGRKILRRALRTALPAVAAALGLGAVLAPPVAAQSAADFPQRPIQLIVGYGAGGATDICFRILAKEVGAKLGQSVAVVNKPGAGSSLSISWLKTQAADGYTISALATGAVLNQFLLRKPPYDVQADLTPISLMALYQAGLLVRADSPYKSAGDVVAAAKARSDGLTFATAGPGTPQHLMMIRLGQLTGAKFIHVPFKNGPEAIAAVMAGDVDVLSQTAEWAQQVKDGRMRLLAVYTGSRMPEFPAVPTIREAGYDLTAPSLLGVVGPKGVPPAVVAKLEGAFQQAAGSADFQNCARQYVLKLDYRPAAGFRDYLAETVKTWGPVASEFASD